jgi:3-oxoacyl-[acyl-carrier protein] reductase
MITGGTRGIGRAIARRFAQEGSNLAICARTQADLDETAAEIEGLGRECFHRPCDVPLKEQCVAFVEEALRHFRQIDILVNNAGGAETPEPQTLLETNDQVWFRYIDLNLHSTWYFTKALLPHLVKHGHGRIVNIASLLALQGAEGWGAYAAAKAGILGMSRVLALEYGKDGVTCNCVCPGGVRAGWMVSEQGAGLEAKRLGLSINEYTAQLSSTTPIKRIVEPEEIAELVLYFASDLSGATTGQAMVVGTT